jgi:hypothetical protein
MYLVLRPPWGGGDIAPIDAGVVAAAPADAGSAKPKRKKRVGARTGGTTGGRSSAGADFSDDGTTDEPAPARIALSAADRALEWRGDNTSISRKIDMNSPADARSLENSEINATVGSQTAPVRQCVIQGATGTDLKTTITVKIVVEGTGKVSRSQLQAPHYLFEKGLLGCAQSALRNLHFPATGAPTLVTFPINLE